MNVEDRFSVIQAEIHQEYDLLSNRMNWYVASQAFLFSAFAISGGAQHVYQWFLRSLIPALSLLISLVLWGAMLAASTAIRQLRRERAHLVTLEPLVELPFGKRPA